MPASIRYLLIILGVFIALLLLEIVNGLIQYQGRIAKSLYFLPLVALLFWGVATRKRWAWHASRILAVLAVIFYVAVGCVAVFGFPDLELARKFWLGGVSAGLGLLAASVFMAGNRPSARTYFSAPL